MGRCKGRQEQRLVETMGSNTLEHEQEQRLKHEQIWIPSILWVLWIQGELTLTHSPGLNSEVGAGLGSVR